MYVQGVSSTAVGGATVAVLPSTGVYRPLFVMGATLAAMGLLMIVTATVSSVKQRTAKNK